MHICLNTYQSPLLILTPMRFLHQPPAEVLPLSVKALEYFLVVPVIFIVVPISFFNPDFESKFFFVNSISVFIPAAPNSLMKSVSNVQRTFKLKMYIFKYISNEFGGLKKLIKYILEIVGKLNYAMPLLQYFPNWTIFPVVYDLLKSPLSDASK